MKQKDKIESFILSVIAGVVGASIIKGEGVFYGFALFMMLIAGFILFVVYKE